MTGNHTAITADDIQITFYVFLIDNANFTH